MKTVLFRLSIVLGLLLSLNALAQTPATGTMSVNDRMAKARAAKAAKRDAASTSTPAMPPSDAKAKKDMKMDDASAKKAAKAETKAAKEGAMAGKDAMKANKGKMNGDMPMAKGSMKEEKATPADYKAPVDRSMKGPNGEAVMTGPRGGKFYINKNGNKTYVSGQKGS